MVALFRPGPMDNIPAYIRRKHGQEAVSYLHPLLEPYLKKTYGIFVYQEDIMAAAMALGGFTGPEADTLGYAIRKKKSTVLRAQKDKFVQRAAERGVAPHVIDAVFKAFEPFERYGFNKAHATCYGLIAYQTAYLKANYTVEYMASVLTAVRDHTDKVAAAVAECRRMGIEVRPPDVHASGLHFTVEGDAIRFGLLAVKNVGQGAIESIIAAREEGGEFTSLRDFCGRVDLRLVNARVMEALTWAGALSRFGHQAQIVNALPVILPAAQAEQHQRATGQISAFDQLFAEQPEEGLPPASEASERERMRWEKELLGLYLSGHPMADLGPKLAAYVNTYSGDLGEELDQQRVVVGGVVTELRRVITKARATMGVATLEDLQGTVEVIIFPKVFEQTGPIWADEAILIVAGRVDHKGDETVLLADAVWTWEEAAALGPDAFAIAVARSDRGRRNGNGRGPGSPSTANGTTNAPQAPMVAVGPGQDSVPGDASGLDQAVDGVPAPLTRTVRRVSPLRGVELEGTIEVVVNARRPVIPEPRSEPSEPVSVSVIAADHSEEPAWPDEARQLLNAAEEAPTVPIQAGPGQSLQIRFRPRVQDEVVRGFGVLRELIHEHPGETAVVLRIPVGPGREQRLELRRGVAYDAELLSQIRRRLGEGLVELELIGPAIASIGPVNAP
jgi:DNA polymerase-3 subunit alpha